MLREKNPGSYRESLKILFYYHVSYWLVIKKSISRCWLDFQSKLVNLKYFSKSKLPFWVSNFGLMRIKTTLVTFSMAATWESNESLISDEVTKQPNGSIFSKLIQKVRIFIKIFKRQTFYEIIHGPFRLSKLVVTGVVGI